MRGLLLLKEKKGITFAAALLVLLVICFGGMVYYVASQKVRGEKTYFEKLNFVLHPGKAWRVGVPISIEGELQISYTSDAPAKVYLGTSGTSFMDVLTIGKQKFSFRVNPSMGVIEVSIQNPHKDISITIAELACVLQYEY